MVRRGILAASMLLVVPEAVAALQAMAPEMMVSTAECHAGRPRVAYNELRDEYLVVWHDQCLATSILYRVWARRLDRHGRPAGDVFEVTSSSDLRDRRDPSVSYDRTEDRYLVVYALDYYGDGSDWDVRGRLLPWYGADPSWGELAIAQSSLDEMQPRVAYSSTSQKFLVTWSQDHPMVGCAIGGNLFAPGSGGAPFTFPADNFRCVPDVALDATTNRFTVVSRAPWDIHARTVEAAGGELGAEQLVSTEAPNEMLAAVASCGTGQAVVTWQVPYSPTDLDLLARFTHADASPDGVVLSIAGSSGNEQESAVACRHEGFEYLIVWNQEWVPWLNGISARRVSVGKEAAPAFAVRIPDADSLRLAALPAVAGGRAGWLVAFEDEVQEPTSHRRICARVVWELFADGFEWGDTHGWSAVSP